MKCPQLSKPEVTTARNQNSIGDRTEKKTLGHNVSYNSRDAKALCQRQTKIGEPVDGRRAIASKTIYRSQINELRFFLLDPFFQFWIKDEGVLFEEG